MENIILHVYYTGKGDAARRFAEEMYASGLRQAVREEDGSMQYDYFFPAQQDGVVLLLEKWRDRAALQAHIDGAVMQKLRALKDKYGLQTTIEKYE